MERRIRVTGKGNIIWYRYGIDFQIKTQDEEYVTVRVHVIEDAMYYWALQYGEIVEVVAPESLRKRIFEGVKKMMEKYDEK